MRISWHFPTCFYPTMFVACIPTFHIHTRNQFSGWIPVDFQWNPCNPLNASKKAMRPLQLPYKAQQFIPIRPPPQVGFSKMRGLAFDGRCKTFDASADGFARGEGIGSVWITRGSGEKTGENELVTRQSPVTRVDLGKSHPLVMSGAALVLVEPSQKSWNQVDGYLSTLENPFVQGKYSIMEYQCQPIKGLIFHRGFKIGCAKWLDLMGSQSRVKLVQFEQVGWRWMKIHVDPE